MRTVDGLAVMDITNTQVAVIGLGASGVAAARLALAKGAEVYVSDSRTETAVAARGADLRMAGASVDIGGHDVDRMASAGIVVVSPGIPPDASVTTAGPSTAIALPDTASARRVSSILVRNSRSALARPMSPLRYTPSLRGLPR